MTAHPYRDAPPTRASQPVGSFLGILCSAIVWLIITACCIIPLGWLLIQISFHPATILSQLRLDSFRISLLSRTIAYNLSVGIVAALLALPAAWVLGRGRGGFSWGLWFVLPISLLMPSLVIAYGWKQLVRMIGLDFEPAGFADVLRCIWSLATWLWPVPAMVVGMALRRSDSQIQQQAVLDGILKRVMFRQIVSPLIASICIVSMLAMQEFAVYEPTGISVVATETRMVFETGAFSSSLNPITAPMGTQSQDGISRTSQADRAAGAVATAIPMLLVVFTLAAVAWGAARRLSAAESVEIGTWPRVLDAPLASVLLSWLTVLITLGVPLISLILSLKRPFSISLIWDEFSPQVLGTLFVSGITGVVAMLLALTNSPRLRRGVLLISLASFLIGGQILAISLIWVYNRPWPMWVHDYVYNQFPIMVMAYIGRFGWIVLGAAMMTWSQPWKPLRDLAAVDGADAMQTARHVIWPLAWPLLTAASIFVLILSLSEVPATVLISPQKPQLLVPMLMTWVHMLRYDAMIEASLLIAGVVVSLGAIATLLGWFGIKLTRFAPILSVGLLFLAGCGDRTKPQAIWCTTGTGPAQVVYPRGIAYSQKDDSFFIVDREARIQHLDNNGKCLIDWRMPKWEQGKPVGITVGPDGDLYVPDTHYHRLMVYKPDGSSFRQIGSKGTGPGQFIYPTDIAFDQSGRIFVTEYGDNDRIQVFDKDFKFLYQFGRFGNAAGEFSRPQSMVIDKDTLYVTDSCNHRIQVFKTDGTFVRTIGKVGGNLGEFRFPYGLDIDSNGRLVVCEFGNNRVQLIDKETGKGLKTWGLPGREPGELAYPWAVAVDKHGRVVAVDSGNNRLQVFEF